MPTPSFNYFYLEGFDWSDLIDELEIPHWTNEHRTDTKPRLYEVRTVKLDDYDERLLILWEPDSARPTDDEIRALIAKDNDESGDD